MLQFSVWMTNWSLLLVFFCCHELDLAPLMFEVHLFTLSLSSIWSFGLSECSDFLCKQTREKKPATIKRWEACDGIKHTCHPSDLCSMETVKIEQSCAIIKNKTVRMYVLLNTSSIPQISSGIVTIFFPSVFT